MSRLGSLPTAIHIRCLMPVSLGECDFALGRLDALVVCMDVYTLQCGPQIIEGRISALDEKV